MLVTVIATRKSGPAALVAFRVEGSRRLRVRPKLDNQPFTT